MNKFSFIALLFLFVMWGAPAAYANEKIMCKILTIEASNSNIGIDEKLGEYTKLFKMEPFSAYNSFKLINTEKVELLKGVETELKLGDNLNGTLKYSGLQLNHLVLSLNLLRADKPPVVIEGKALPGTPFLAAGLKSGNGRFVIAVKCQN
ncbi:MAG: hypothetical protein JXR91_05735 [Deltaproteobacteria bacterium]|nr:hypothetical protein [Deltaproteobacteria bacterium]